MMTSAHCHECGLEVAEFCAAHPNAMIDSIIYPAPHTAAYLAAHAALMTADALDNATACTCAPVDATCAGCDARTAYHVADRACDAARAAWLASDERRAWKTGGESWGGESGDNIEGVAPSEIEERLADDARDGDWTVEERTIWIHDIATPIDPATGKPIEAARVAVTTTIQPPAPACARGRDHQWRSPYSVLGGIAENPGVWGKGGGVIIREVCAHCACYRVTDTWAQDRSTGEQGLTEVSYEEADDASLAWVSRRVVVEAEAAGDAS